jgi:hypothetical protein
MALPNTAVLVSGSEGRFGVALPGEEGSGHDVDRLITHDLDHLEWAFEFLGLGVAGLHRHRPVVDSNVGACERGGDVDAVVYRADVDPSELAVRVLLA